MHLARRDFNRSTYATACGLLVFTLLIASCSPTGKISETSGEKQSHYTLVIDAGSSGSRVYIYQIEPQAGRDIPVVTMVGSEKVNPGISEFENDPEVGARNILTLLDYARAQIGADSRKQTPVYLLATAGMRLYSSDKRDRIMDKVGAVIRDEGSFSFMTAMTISGRYEGLYGWLALNYLDDQFDPAQKRESLLEMGGASTQITFTPKDKFKEHKLKRKIKGEQYRIYSRSYLYMGINEAEKLLGIPACYPLNYPMKNGGKGTGECDECARYITEKFNAICEGLERDGPHCVFMSSPVPLIDEDYLAVSSFYYVFKSLGLGPNINLAELKEKANEFCGQDYNVLQEKYPDDRDYLHQYCLASTYYWNLFKNGYRFPTDQTKISGANTINGMDITWTLGALLDIQMGFQPEAYIRD